MLSLFQNIKHIPRSPGVYFFKSAKGEILYIGKAKDLRKRISQYKQGRMASPQTAAMLSKAAFIDFLVAPNEVESLIWENNLIKEHQPKYNIRLRDDKNYLYIKISDEPFPKITTEHQPNDGGTFIPHLSRISRPAKRDCGVNENKAVLQAGSNAKLKGAGFIGPFTSSEYVQATLKTLRKIFPYRTCNIMPKKPCLYFFIKLCPAPCVGKISQEDYGETVKKISQILLGKDRAIAQNLKEQMLAASQNREYEKAARLRDQWRALEHIFGRDSGPRGDEDIFSAVKSDQMAAVHLFIIRERKMIRQETFLFDRAKDFSENEILKKTFLTYYEYAAGLPKNIIVSHPPADPDLISRWLNNLAKKMEQPAPKIIIPKRGEKTRYIKIGVKNAMEKINWHKISQNLIKKQAAQTFSDFQKILSLPQIPSRIECFDISNIQGTHAVGSMVVFSVQSGSASGGENLKPKKSDYRRFVIKTVFGANDPAMMKEVISRRLEHKEWPKPDLIILDGGKPQLFAISKLFNQKNIKIPLAALAKKEEEIHIPLQSQPIRLEKNSPTLHILQAIRDEAHRFAIAHFRGRQAKALLKPAGKKRI